MSRAMVRLLSSHIPPSSPHHPPASPPPLPLPPQPPQSCLSVISLFLVPRVISDRGEQHIKAVPLPPPKVRMRNCSRIPIATDQIG